MSEDEDRLWIHTAPSWLQIIGVLFSAGVAITATFYSMFYGLKEELARIDERQKFVLATHVIQDAALATLKRDRDEQFREITRQLSALTADINAFKVLIAAKGK